MSETIDTVLPPREFSLMPFWFWNDDLNESELIRQIAEFEAHGVYGFVIHPRVGLPRSLGWMSDGLLRFMDIAIAEARRRGMKVILYDEGMYPSGSSSGQVVAENPEYACRCLAKFDLAVGERLRVQPGQNLVADLTTTTGRRIAVIDRKVDAYIRGLHYIGDGSAEDEPPMADILNPSAVAALIRLVYDRFHSAFGKHFGRTVIGIFTDEPNALGKCREADVWPGTTGILKHVNAALGYDFTPHLPMLWSDASEPLAEKYRKDYAWAVQRRLEETWYRPLSDWCHQHGIALCGHPAGGDEIGVQRYFDIPGQDLVWRFVEPHKPSALEGPESTQGKCSSSAMIHLQRRRNSNEFCGAYGHQTTFEEMKWLANWCLVRGVNLLIPHAFYYSVRGCRRDERPPQLGPNSPWWDRFKPFADHCARLCWINTDCTHVCDIAILTGPDHCPWRAAKICFENQRDFNYLEVRMLHEAIVDSDGIRLAGMHYRVLIVDGMDVIPYDTAAILQPLVDGGRVVVLNSAALIESIDRHCAADVTLSNATADLRYRHVIKDRQHFYLFFNEGAESIQVAIAVSASGKRWWIDTETGVISELNGPLEMELAAGATALLRVSPD